MDRYDLDCGSPMNHRGPSMEKEIEGDWVKYEDHKRELDRLKKRNALTEWFLETYHPREWDDCQEWVKKELEG